MAIHDSPASMLKESLIEILDAAKYCSDYRKNEEKWGIYKTGGCLGYPAGILLFSIIDSIGSYFRKAKNFKIMIDGHEETIDSDGLQHFKILNSKYFNQNLSGAYIQNLYIKFRSYLTHNSVLSKNAMMIMNNTSLDNGITGKAFFIGANSNGETMYVISIKELWELCNSAIELFLKDVDAVVPNSKQGNKFN